VSRPGQSNFGIYEGTHPDRQRNITHAVRAPALPRVCGAETSLEGFTAGDGLWALVNAHEGGKNRAASSAVRRWSCIPIPHIMLWGGTILLCPTHTTAGSQ
jgi:hypothetical protein